MEPQAKVQRTSRCDGCGGGPGTRVRLGDESGPVRICFCATCDIPPGVVAWALPPGARTALHTVGGAA